MGGRGSKKSGKMRTSFMDGPLFRSRKQINSLLAIKESFVGSAPVRIKICSKSESPGGCGGLGNRDPSVNKCRGRKFYKFSFVFLENAPKMLAKLTKVLNITIMIQGWKFYNFSPITISLGLILFLLYQTKI